MELILSRMRGLSTDSKALQTAYIIEAPVITRGNHYLVITGNYLVITNPFLRLPVMEQAGSSKER